MTEKKLTLESLSSLLHQYYHLRQSLRVSKPTQYRFFSMVLYLKFDSVLAKQAVTEILPEFGARLSLIRVNTGPVIFQ